MKKIYEVLIQDIYNNLHFIGFYKQLENSIEDINEFLSIYNITITKEILSEFSTTLGLSFDLDLSTIYEEKDEAYGVCIRGFIFDDLDFLLSNKEV